MGKRTENTPNSRFRQRSSVHKNTVITVRNRQVKLADFGVAMKMSGDGAQGGQAGGAEDNPDMAGSPYWMAPEIIEMSTPTSACDIWCACVFMPCL